MSKPTAVILTLGTLFVVVSIFAFDIDISTSSPPLEQGQVSFFTPEDIPPIDCNDGYTICDHEAAFQSGPDSGFFGLVFDLLDLAFYYWPITLLFFAGFVWFFLCRWPRFPAGDV